MRKIFIILSLIIGLGIIVVLIQQAIFPGSSLGNIGTQLEGAVRNALGREESFSDELGGELAAEVAEQPTARREYFTYESDPEYVYKKYLLATYLYTKHQEVRAIPLAIAYAAQLGKFDEAAKLIKQLPDLKLLNKQLDPHAMMRLLFNTADLSFKHMKHLKELIETFTEEGKFTKADQDFYFALMNIAKGDLTNTRHYVTELSGSVYAYLRQDFQTLYQLKKQYANASDTYMQSLLGMAVYKLGRRGISQHVGEEVIMQDPNYLLAHQLVAYSSMSLQSRKKAIKELQKLQDLHPEYADVYQFFQAIAHYFQGKYAESILVFQQVPTQSAYYHDALRYLYLSYIALGDFAKAGEVAKQLLGAEQIVIADIYTIFDTVFYHPLKEETWFALYELYPDVVANALTICESRFSEHGYVCLYGKAGKLLAEQEDEKALRLLEGVVKRYPRPELYEYIADMYRKAGDKKTAQEWYQQAFLLAEGTPGEEDLQSTLDKVVR